MAVVPPPTDAKAMALHRCLLEEDTDEETASRQCACDRKFPWLCG